MRTVSKISTVLATLTAFALLLPMAASAKTLAALTRSNNFTFVEPNIVSVPLDASGTTIITFKAAARKPVVIAYTAECSVFDNVASWLDLDILVDGVAVPPTDTAFGEDAFCTAHANLGFNYRMSAVNAVFIPSGGGTHTLEIKARIRSGNTGATGWLGDTSLIVTQQ